MRSTHAFHYDTCPAPSHRVGNWVADALLAVPGVADVQLLQPVLGKLARAIRSVDPDKIIFYENTPVHCPALPCSALPCLA
jgi:hypothetical protein